MSTADDLREILAVLEAEGVRVSFADDRLAVEGAHDDLSIRARVAIETIEGRGAQLRRVFAEANLASEERARLEREREAVAAMKAGGAAGAAKRWGHAKPKPKPEAVCGHDPKDAYIDEAGWKSYCKTCRRIRRRERAREGRMAVTA